MQAFEELMILLIIAAGKLAFWCFLFMVLHGVHTGLAGGPLN